MRSPFGARMTSREPLDRARPRWSAGLVLATTAGYLLWRTTTLGSGGRLVLSIPMFALEVWAAARLGVLVASTRRARPRAAQRRTRAVTEPLDVVISAAGSGFDDIELSLIACASLPGERAIVVLDSMRRREIADLARDHGVFYDTRSVDPIDDPTMLFSDLVSAERVLWIRGGQTPMPDVDTAARLFDSPDVAVVQIAVGARNDDSMVHIDRGRDEHALDWSVVAPALSSRGYAPWTGPGSIVRREAVLAALRQAPPHPRNARAVEPLLVRLHAAGFATRFEPRRLVRAAAPDALDAYLTERREQASRALAVLRGVDSPVSGHAVGLRVRLRHLAALAPWFDGIRLLAFAGVVAAVIVSGTMPVDGDVITIAPPAAAVFAAGAVTRRRIAGTTMATGDWIRGAWRTVGADLAGLAGSTTRHADSDRSDRKPRWQRLGQLRLLTASIVMIELAIVARAATLVWGGMLPAFTTAERVVVLMTGLATLVPMIDVAQLLVGRRQRRHTYRIKAALPIVVAGSPTTTIDLAANGAAFTLGTAPALGDALPVELALPRIDGSRTSISATATVRSVVPLDDGRVRVGVTLGDLPVVDRAALLSYCTVDHPFLARGSDATPAPELCPGDLDIAVVPLRRRAVRALTAAAAVLGLTTAAAGPAFAAVPSSICVRSSVDGVADLTIQAYVEGRGPTDPGWTVAGITNVDGCLALDPAAGVDTDVLEVELHGQRAVVDVPADGGVVIELVRLTQDDGAEIVTEINLGTAWEQFEPGMEVLPGRIAARTSDGSVVKIEVVGGTEVSLPSGTSTTPSPSAGTETPTTAPSPAPAETTSPEVPSRDDEPAPTVTPVPTEPEQTTPQTATAQPAATPTATMPTEPAPTGSDDLDRTGAGSEAPS